MNPLRKLQGGRERRRAAARAADVELRRRKETVLADPKGQAIWEALAANRVHLNTRVPVTREMREAFYVRLTEALLEAVKD